MPRTSKVLLVQPSYLRLYGSHNNRVPLELCYLHRFLAEAGTQSRVVNLDHTDATSSIPWSQLYQNSHLIDAYLRSESPLLDESIERILSYDPEVVVISGGDSLTPWADLGNPYIASLLSQKLRLYEVYTIGVGPFFGRVPGRFTDSFDAILTGPASPSICELVRSRPSGEFTGLPLPASSAPLIDLLGDTEIANVVMTSIGCPFRCTFCMGAATGSKNLDLEAVAADIQSRNCRLIEIGDAVFPLGAARLNDIEAAFSGLDREFACEMRVASCDPSTLRRLASLGVVQIKLGIESGSDHQLREIGKRQTVTDIEWAVHNAKSEGLQVTGYVLLGGNHARQRALATLDLCERLNIDDLVVNVLSHFDLRNRDFSRDAHWSKGLAELWSVADVMPYFFKMQAREKPGVGKLLHSLEESRR